MKKLSRGQKAWATRKANTKKKDKVAESLKEAVETQGLKIGDVLRINLPNDFIVTDGPALISLSKALDNSLDKLEQRMIDYIERVDRILA